MEFCSKELNTLLRHYLKTLDTWQTEVENIRAMHHDIWKESRVNQIIKQHRAGSRVERYTRILPQGKRTDVDYKFEVVGIKVNSFSSNTTGLYWIPSSSSPAYGKVYLSSDCKLVLGDSELYSQIFNQDTFRWDPKENAFLLLPDIFKKKVVEISGFSYAERMQEKVQSPSIPGDGAVNEYDIVPCLQMSQWPDSATTWLARCNDSSKILNAKWRRKLKEHPLYVVAMGYPTSSDFEIEFRLSFSLVELQCFLAIPDYARQLYGLSRYIFKISLEPVDLLQSYHLKTLFLWTLEEFTEETLKNIQPLEFVRILFLKVKKAIQYKEVRHFFVDKCNLFPLHKPNCSQKQMLCENIFESFDAKLVEISISLLQTDLDLPIDPLVSDKAFHDALACLCKQEQMQPYTDSYLTRLLSVTTFSLYENEEHGTLVCALDRINKVFLRYTYKDKHFPRIIPMVNATLSRLTNNNAHISTMICAEEKEIDKISFAVHEAFEAYIRREFVHVHKLLQAIIPYVKGLSRTTISNNGLGISITKYHKQFALDEPLKFVVKELEKRSKNGNCPRFYVDPIFLALHIQRQIEESDTGELMAMMEDLTMSLPDHVPYKGKLSYKFSAVCILHGYKSCMNFKSDYELSIPNIYGLDSFDGMRPTNFEMR